MTRQLETRLQRLLTRGDPGVLREGLRGIERETLRITPAGYIAATPHPRALGSALTNRFITTDYSEALLEFITPPLRSNAGTMQYMDDIHQFAYEALGDELMWALSMPCMIRSEEDIPIARYGSSNVGMMKTVYRRGLGLRYGRYMQSIAGVHFNYSVPDAFWPVFTEIEGARCDASDLKSEVYLGAVRNVRRMDWLLLYLFGASSAVCKCFLPRGDAGLQEFDRGTYYAPFATSLRMSDIGYKNSSQAAVIVSANSLEEYIRDLGRAIRTPEPAYEKLGVRGDGGYLQLNPNRLQIENEYYSTIRPKRATLSGERPTAALRRGGVEYVELRSLDVSPFERSGIGIQQLQFCEAFLIYCVMSDSPRISRDEQLENDSNHGVVARRGREPGLMLRRKGAQVPMRAWAEEIIAGVLAVAELLDRTPADGYTAAVRAAGALMGAPDGTPAARMINDMRSMGQTLADYGMTSSRGFREYFRQKPRDENSHRSELLQEAAESLERQRWIEEHDRVSFEDYLAAYYA